MAVCILLAKLLVALCVSMGILAGSNGTGTVNRKEAKTFSLLCILYRVYFIVYISCERDFFSKIC